MTFEEFQTLPEESQMAAVFANGTFVATRWQEEHEAVQLYKMPSGFFAELTYNTTDNEVLYPGSFDANDPDRLEDYAMFVRLPNWMPEAEQW